MREAETELAIWQRSLPPELTDWLSQRDVSTFPHLRLLVEPDSLRPALAPLLEQSGLAAGEMRDLLLHDIAELVKVFAEITGGEQVDVRLERISHDACWKFHRDNVAIRLVTTYFGPTTEWVPLEHGEQALREQRQYDGPIRRLGGNDVAIFRGSQSGGNKGIVHRSPPIEKAKKTRLFLCLNQRTIASPVSWANDKAN